jgi:hypothetical protein
MITWIIRSEIKERKTESRIIAKYVAKFENEIRVILRSLIIGLTLLNKKFNIQLGVDIKINSLIKEFLAKKKIKLKKYTRK